MYTWCSIRGFHVLAKPHITRSKTPSDKFEHTPEEQSGAPCACSLWLRSGGQKSHLSIQVLELFVLPQPYIYIYIYYKYKNQPFCFWPGNGLVQKSLLCFKNTLEPKLGEFCAAPPPVPFAHGRCMVQQAL